VIVVDTSALLAVVLSEPEGERCLAALRSEPELILSAGTAVEAGITAIGKGVPEAMAELLRSLPLRVVPTSEAMVDLAVEAFRVYGKGRHPAGLNYGDCFSYAAARHYDCPLLFIGNDFSRTDLRSALPPV
jgi:ribonuclease VapC